MKLLIALSLVVLVLSFSITGVFAIHPFDTPTRDEYFPNDPDGYKWIRLYKVQHSPSGTMGAECSYTRSNGVFVDATRSTHIDWNANQDDEALNVLVDEIMQDWGYITPEIKFVRAERDEPAHIIFYRSTDSPHLGSVTNNPCYTTTFASGDSPHVYFAEVVDGFDTFTDPFDNEEGGISRSERYPFIGSVRVDPSLVGSATKETMGIFTHEFGHLLGQPHGFDIMFFGNTNGGHIVTGETTLAVQIGRSTMERAEMLYKCKFTPIAIRGAPCNSSIDSGELHSQFPDYTLEEFKQFRSDVRVKYLTPERKALLENWENVVKPNFFDFRVWPTPAPPEPEPEPEEKSFTFQRGKVDKIMDAEGIRKALFWWSKNVDRLVEGDFINVTRIQ